MLYWLCAFWIFPIVWCEKPHSRVFCAALKVKIFLIITNLSKNVGYTGLSMRLPPKAAKPICCFLMEKEKGGLSNRHWSNDIFWHAKMILLITVFLFTARQYLFWFYTHNRNSQTILYVFLYLLENQQEQ